MEEKEIIEFLKSNKTKGIAFKFLPEEVQDWIGNHKRECVILNSSGVWNSTKDYLSDDSDIDAFCVFCLLESFTLPKKEKGEWVEFGVNEYGIFAIRDGELDCLYNWWDWGEALKCNSYEYSNFGGWQYEEDGFWYMEPQLIDEEGDYRGMSNSMEKVTPIIPKKIRFWRRQ